MNLETNNTSIFYKKYKIIKEQYNNIIKKDKLNEYSKERKILFYNLDNIIHSINTKEFLKKNINIYEEYSNILENINNIMKDVSNTSRKFLYTKISINGLKNSIKNENPNEINLFENKHYSYNKSKNKNIIELFKNSDRLYNSSSLKNKAFNLFLEKGLA